jgi:hypothetical protein
MEEIEFTPEEAAAIPTQAGDDAGQAGADAEDEEIEMTGNEEIEITADGEVKLIGEAVGDVFIGYPREVSEDEALRNQKHAHEMEIGELHSVDELRAYSKELIKDIYERDPEMRDEILGDLDQVEDNRQGYASLLTRTRDLLKERDLQAEEHGRLEARYGDEIAGDPGLQTYDQLADYFTRIFPWSCTMERSRT